MNLSEVRTKIAKCTNEVINKTFVLDLLASIERDECPNCTRIPVYDMETFSRGLQSVKGGDPI